MKIAERTATWRRERRVLLRVSRAAWRLDQAERERSWALASARAEGVSIRALAAAVRLSSSRVHQIVAAADLDELDAALGELRAAQRRCLPGERLVEFALGRALEDPGHLGQQVSPAGRELAKPGHRGGFLVRSQVTPLRAVPGLPSAERRGYGQPAAGDRSCVLVSRMGAPAEPAPYTKNVQFLAQYPAAFAAAMSAFTPPCLYRPRSPGTSPHRPAE
jgi:hypothetical protein